MRDTIARRSDVEKSSMTYEVEDAKKRYSNGTITFAAKKGEYIDLLMLHEKLKATRLGKNTSSGVNFFDITVAGEVKIVDKKALLKVKYHEFLLGEDPKAAKPKEGKSPYERLREAVTKGEKTMTVTGRVAGWNGKWPAVLRDLADPTAQKQIGLSVIDFQTAK